MAKQNFVVVPELTAIAVAYKQSNLIADQVLPYVPVSTQEFRYKKFNLGDDFTVPNTLVGRKSAPNQVEFGETEVTAAVVDRGLDAPVPNRDIEAYERAVAAGARNTTDPLMRATNQLMQLMATAREKRVADLVFNAANYATANKRTLSGTTQWSDYTNSTPQADIFAALDSMIMRPNIGVMGRAAWSVLAQHPKICKAIFGNNTDAGVVTRQQVAQLFELDDLLVGDGWINTAAKGQPPSVVRMWGKKAAFIYRNMSADTDFGITFGFTARWGDRIAGRIDDADIGLRGGVRSRAGESVIELLTANDLGYLFDTAVA